MINLLYERKGWLDEWKFLSSGQLSERMSKNIVIDLDK